MSTTTVHIPKNLLTQIDAIAQRRGVSRNRIVLASLEAEVARDAGEWPEQFFQELPQEEALLLAEATREMETGVRTHRVSRGAVIL